MAGEMQSYLRVPLPGSAEGNATLSFEHFTCESVRLISDAGGSGLVYEGISRDYYGLAKAAPARLVIKECYPVEVAPWITREGNSLVVVTGAPASAAERLDFYLSRFEDAFATHTALYQSALKEMVTVPVKTCFANNTAYIVTDASEGITLETARGAMTAAARTQTLCSIAEFLAALHTMGYLYLDLKPSNVLVVFDQTNDGRLEYRGRVKFFDFDSVARIGEALDHVPSSGVWAAYEQIHTVLNYKIGTVTDVYSFGVLLFEMLFGRIPTSTEIIHANGHWSVSPPSLDSVFVQPLTGNDLQAAMAAVAQSLLDNTLVPNPDCRTASFSDIADDLQHLRSFFTPADPAVTREIEKLNMGLSAIVKPSTRRRFLMVSGTLLGAAALFGIGFGVNAILKATQENKEQSAADAIDAQILGVWHSIKGRTQKDTYGAKEPWNTTCVFEFFADHTMTWNQDGETFRYRWSYNDHLPGSGLTYDGYDQYYILADPNKYSGVSFNIPTWLPGWEDKQEALCYLYPIGANLDNLDEDYVAADRIVFSHKPETEIADESNEYTYRR